MKKVSFILLLIIVLFIGIKFYIFDVGIPFWVKPDIGPELHVFGKPCLWKSSSVQMGKTGYVASVGPNIYQDKSNQLPDFYTIDIPGATDKIREWVAQATRCLGCEATRGASQKSVLLKIYATKNI